MSDLEDRKRPLPLAPWLSTRHVFPCLVQVNNGECLSVTIPIMGHKEIWPVPAGWMQPKHRDDQLYAYWECRVENAMEPVRIKTMLLGKVVKTEEES